MRPGNRFVDGLVTFDDTVVDGVVDGTGIRVAGDVRHLPADPDRLRPQLRPVRDRRRPHRRPRSPGGELRMNDFPWLTASLLLPLVGAVVVLRAARAARAADAARSRPRSAFSVATLARSRSRWRFQYDIGTGGYQLEETHTWIAAFGAHYALGVDGLGLTLVLLTTILTPVVIAASWNDGDRGRWSVNSFFAWMLALEGLAIGTFAATDVFLFYVLFEATLIPIYFLIGGFGGARRSYAAVKFLIFSLLGGLIMLAVGHRPLRAVGAVAAADRRTSSPSWCRSWQNVGTGTGRWLFVGVLHRLRDEGADVPGAHLAAGRRRRGDARHLGAAGEHPRQDRHLRHDAVLPGAVPRGVDLGDAGRARARGVQHPVRRAGGDRPALDPAADRLHLGVALRLHRARHLRAEQPGPGRLDALHVQPRPLDRRCCSW